MISNSYDATDLPSTCASQSQQQTQFINSSQRNFDELFEVFVLSEAGKPIYTYSKREDAITLMPLCSTLVNYAHNTQKETLHCIKTSDNLKINFTVRSPLIIIVFHKVDSQIDTKVLIDQIEAQIASIFTLKTLHTLFAERPTFDLKRLLHGSEKLIDSLINNVFPNAYSNWPAVETFLSVNSTSNLQTNDKIKAADMKTYQPSYMQVPVFPMTSSARDAFHNILSLIVSSNSKSIVFSLIFRLVPTTKQDCDDNGSSFTDPVNENFNAGQDNFRFSLMTVCNHHTGHKLSVTDIQIIMAVLNGSKFQLASGESWVPICLLRFNKDAFLHSHISYINDSQHCLILLTVDRDEFNSCQRLTEIIEDKINQLLKNVNMTQKINYQMSPLVHPVLFDSPVSDIGDRGSISSQQRAQIFNSSAELYHARQLQFVWYQTPRQVLFWQRSANCEPSRALFYLMKKMSQSSLCYLWLRLTNQVVYGNHKPQTNVQLYLQFDTSIATSQANDVIKLVTNWIKKEEENFSLNKEYK